jgi:hypothetical protein
MDVKTVVVKGIPVLVWKRLKLRALERDQTLQSILVQAIEAYLTKAA